MQVQDFLKSKIVFHDVGQVRLRPSFVAGGEKRQFVQAIHPLHEITTGRANHLVEFGQRSIWIFLQQKKIFFLEFFKIDKQK